jgi:hypothetical protein
MALVHLVDVSALEKLFESPRIGVLHVSRAALVSRFRQFSGHPFRDYWWRQCVA